MVLVVRGSSNQDRALLLARWGLDLFLPALGLFCNCFVILTTHEADALPHVRGSCTPMRVLLLLCELGNLLY